MYPAIPGKKFEDEKQDLFISEKILKLRETLHVKLGKY
jgi:hypothetical protein